MEIRIYTTGGSIERFFQDDPVLEDRIIKGIQPARLFAGTIITIAGEYSLTTVAASRITRVDFITRDLAPWKQPADVLDVFEISEEEFQERTHLNDPARLERRRIPKRTGDAAVCFVEAEMVGGSQIFLATRIKVPLEAERLQRLHTLFSAPAVHFGLRQGGYAILNLKNLVRTTFNPGPDVTPADAWPAQHLPRQRAFVLTPGGRDSNDQLL